jgi:hypothetical protein
MATEPQSRTETPQSASVPEPSLIREQLNRLLAHSLFSHSKRYPVLLAYTVEQTLLGNAANLKERTIGAEAFGRKPDYDVNQDPVVRTSAAEVRKRLIQYYYDSEHAGELVIELSAGSYVPAFRMPEPQGMEAAELQMDAASYGASSSEPEAGPEDFPQAAEPTLPNAEISQAAKSASGFRWTRLAALLIVALAAGIGIGRYRPTPPLSNMERFWEPITSSQDPITYCIGEPGTFEDLKRSPGTAVEDPSVLGRLNISDVVTLARSIVPLDPRNGGFRVLSSSQTSFAQLREGPIVLIGAFSNLWTMRVTEKLRFGFEMKDGVGRLVDRKGPHPTSWNLQRDASSRKVVRDYAIVARIHDDTTGQPVILIAGILGTGTEAAGEVIYNPTYLDLLLQKAPKNWDRKNLEAVIETNVFENNPGPPNILAVETW